MRRFTVGLLFVVFAFGMLTAAPVRSIRAQEATPVAGAHALVGSWFFYDRAQPQMNEAHWLLTFAADGTVTAAVRSQEFSAGQGAWRPTGNLTAEANVVVFVTTAGYGQELSTFHLALTVAADGMTLTSANKFDNVTASGAIDRDVVPGIQWNGIRISADPDQVVKAPAT